MPSYHRAKGKSALESKLIDVFAAPGVDTNLVIVTAFEGEASALGNDHGRRNHRAVDAREFSARLFETFYADCRRCVARTPPRRGRARPHDRFSRGTARRAATAIGLSRAARKIGRIAFSARGALRVRGGDSGHRRGADARHIQCGPIQNVWRHTFCFSKCAIIVGGYSTQRARGIREHCNMARQVDNEPGNTLTPAVFAGRLAEPRAVAAFRGAARARRARASRHGDAARRRPREPSRHGWSRFVMSRLEHGIARARAGRQRHFDGAAFPQTRARHEWRER